MIGIDTSALIDLFKIDKNLLELLSTIEEPVFLNYVVYFELMLGLDPENKNHGEEEAFFDEIFNTRSCLELNLESCKKARNIFWDLKKEGKSIQALDCAIAGIYLNNGVNKIITKNKSHFERIKGLKVLSY